MITCKGCGVELQYERANEIGYTPKKDGEFCQRCFRLTHYDDYMFSMKTGIDSQNVFNRIAHMDALVLWVVDCFDFEAGMIEGLNRHLPNKDIILVVTKRDLLPPTLGMEKLSKFIFSRLKEYNIYVQGLVVVGKGFSNNESELKKAIEKYRNGRDVVVMGKANAGKSTLLNELLHNGQLTASKYPGTTLDFNACRVDEYTMYDTPGIEVKKSMLVEVAEEDLATIMLTKAPKAKVFQCRDDQSFHLGGLVRLDFYGCEKASIVFYMSNQLSIHRGKAENAADMFERHKGKDFLPVPLVDSYTKSVTRQLYEKMDIVIDGLGWVCVSGSVKSISVTYPKNVNITYRKAIL